MAADRRGLLQGNRAGCPQKYIAGDAPALQLKSILESMSVIRVIRG